MAGVGFGGSLVAALLRAAAWQEVLAQLSNILREMPQDWAHPSGEEACDLVDGLGRQKAPYDRWVGRGLVCWALPRPAGSAT